MPHDILSDGIFHSVGTVMRCRLREREKRKTTGRFVCDHCGEENADRNAAFNIAKRGLGHISKLGVVVVNLPRTPARIEMNPMMTGEALGLVRQ
jgi:hypothetical protein